MQYREYDIANMQVRNHYKKMRENHTLEFNQYMREKYLKYETKIKIWDAISMLEEFIDVSDPDINLPNIYHLFQTAEAIRADGLPDWFQLVGLIHDLGKVLYMKGCNHDGTSVAQQWSIVGDTFIVGCRLPETLVYPEFNDYNSDMDDSSYNTDYGIYEPNCGLDNCLCSFGHDEYLYQVLKHNKVNLPLEALHIIRYHSLYAWHQEKAYEHLANESDMEKLKWLKLFQEYDLYTKCDKTIDLNELKKYYSILIDKYFPSDFLYW